MLKILSTAVGLILLTTVTNAQPGTLDATFNPGSATNGSLNSISLQSDGKVILGGDFTLYTGYSRTRVVRILPNGAIDTSFQVGVGADGIIYCTQIQPTDGKILISGYLNNYDGHASRGIARLNTNGTFDNTFAVGLGLNGGAYGDRGIVVQPDGKIIVGGLFTSYNGNSRKYIVRINSDGSLDTSFDPGTGANAQIYPVLLQPDGKVIIAGSFTTFNGVAKNYITRLNSDGSIDPAFNVGVGTDAAIQTAALLPNGQIIIAGTFNYYDNNFAPGIARINSDGSFDNTFNAGIGNDGSLSVNSMFVQPDGKILLVGSFLTWNGATASRLVRLNADGTTDISFVTGTGASATVKTCGLQTDGRIMIGGNFTSYNGTARKNICRINGNLEPDAAFSVSSHIVCDSGIINLTDASGNFPSTWQWSCSPSVGTNISNSSSQNTSIAFTALGDYIIKLVVSNVTGIDSITDTIHVYQSPTAIATPQGPTSFCQGGNVQITANSASSYLWSNGNATQNIIASQTGNYFVVITDANGCTDTSNIVPVQENIIYNPGICMVTVDTTSDHNIIYWDKSGNLPSDTFLIYRDTANYNYAWIGSVPYDSLSVFNDTLRSLYNANGDPNVSSWRYKIAVKDSCGTISAMSSYHQTIFIQNSLGNFSWNHYQIEGQVLPVPALSGYAFYRDDFSAYNWNVIQVLSASSTAYTDPNFTTYQSTGRWRANTIWTISCSDSTGRLSAPNTIMGAINTSRSNVKSPTSIGVVESSRLFYINISPNPAKENVYVEISTNEAIDATITIENALGESIYTEQTSKQLNSINTADLSAGVYLVEVKSDKARVIKKLIIQ